MSQPTRLPILVAVIAAVTCCSHAQAQTPDAKAEAAKQKDVVRANLKKMDLTKASVIETENFFVASMLSDEKAKQLGAAIEKVVPLARKALQYDAKEEAWKGKLAVYYFPESKDFKTFVRTIVMTKPEGVHYDLRADAPYVVDPVDVLGKTTEVEQFSTAAANVAAAYLIARGSSATIPEWLRAGFGRATAMRAEGNNSGRYQAFKKQAKAAASGSKTGAAPTIADLWGETKNPNSEVLAASLVDYMAYGPGAANFSKLVFGFRPDENGNTPSTMQALEAADWKDTAMLEAAWRKWLASGKP